jgi:hypothetical protein
VVGVTGPTVRFGTPLEGKPFDLAFDWDGEEASLFLTVEELRVLVASGDAALVEHRQATCGHVWGERFILPAGGFESRCLDCDLVAVVEGDTVVPVEEGP